MPSYKLAHSLQNLQINEVRPIIRIAKFPRHCHGGIDIDHHHRQQRGIDKIATE